MKSAFYLWALRHILNYFIKQGYKNRERAFYCALLVRYMRVYTEESQSSLRNNVLDSFLQATTEKYEFPAEK